MKNNEKDGLWKNWTKIVEKKKKTNDKSMVSVTTTKYLLMAIVKPDEGDSPCPHPFHRSHNSLCIF